ncbi:MAG TPA: NAD-dependent deacylase [Pyrinomonadaceae bacterium]|nr:NAD-dependent deacylase [Pyrinomonadaceae bacterium]
MQQKSRVSIPAHARERFDDARRVFVLTGAGVSAESGVPTFRGGGGAALWKGIPFDVISSARMVERDLRAVWEWFDYRRELLKSVRPNPAQDCMAAWQNRFERLTVATQNIDGLHAAAGSRGVLELHGNIWTARCVECCEREDVRQLDSHPRPPVCRACAGEMRPDVVLFGEMLPVETWTRAAEAAATCDVCVVVGTSAIVHPAASLPLAAKEAGAYLVEVNPERTPLSDLCDATIQGPAGEALPLFDS